MAAKTNPTIADVVFDAEDDMRKVKDLAHLVHDYMVRPGGVDADTAGALSWLTCELIEIGERLRTARSAMHAAIHGGSDA